MSRQQDRERERFDPCDEWTAMPEFEQQDLRAAWRVVVHFRSDADAEEFFKLIGRPKRRTLWWPEHDGHHGGGKQFAWIADEPAQAA